MSSLLTSAKNADQALSKGLFDVHLHYIPDNYRQVAVASGMGAPDGMPGMPAWSEEAMIDMMEQVGISKGMLSISSPGVHFGDDAVARDLARMANEEGIRLKTARPGKFGLFAAIPLPDVEGALSEIDYAMDVLGADGIYLQSNAGGVYPGEPLFEPIFAELNRRAATVFMHPTSPACPCCGPRTKPMPRPVLEFMFDTTRAVTSLIISGTLARYPNIKMIVPHAGATLPVLADRIAFTAGLLPNMGDLDGEAVMQTLAGLYYDLAGAVVPRLLPALRTFADPTHLLYGSDWPHTPLPAVMRLRSQLDVFLVNEPEFLQDIHHRNGRQLFPNI